jgi:hypothetical protein
VIEFELSRAHGGAVELHTAEGWTVREVLLLSENPRGAAIGALVRFGAPAAEAAALAERFTGPGPVALTPRELHVVHRAFSRVGLEPYAEQLVHDGTGLFRAEVAELAERLAGAAAALDATAADTGAVAGDGENSGDDG